MALPMYVGRRILHGPSAQCRVLRAMWFSSVRPAIIFLPFYLFALILPYAPSYHYRLRIGPPALGISQFIGRDIYDAEKEDCLSTVSSSHFSLAPNSCSWVELASNPSTSDLLAHAANAPLQAIPQGSLLHIDPAEKALSPPVGH